MATCYVRIYLPLNSNHKAIAPVDNPGHFDIQVMGTLSIAKSGKTYTNPIVSYDGDGVSIYDNGNLPWKNNWMLCTFSFDAYTFDWLASWINTYCEMADEEEDTSDMKAYRDLYKVTSGEFTTYSKATHSCFAAVARWCYDMGYTYLMTIYNQYTYPNGTDSSADANGYLNYTAWPMFRQYYTGWAFKKLQTN